MKTGYDTLAMKLFAATLTVLLMAPAATMAAPVNTVTDVNTGESQPFYAFHPVNAEFEASASTDGNRVGVSVRSKSDPATHHYDFSAPPGERLEPGIYDYAAGSITQPGRPSMFGGCMDESGRFEVKDIATAADGTVQRLWIIYDQRCDAFTEGHFGEIRIGQPSPDGAPVVAPAIMRWPEGDVGRPFRQHPVTVVAPSGGMRVASTARTGSTDFAIASDECSGKDLTANASCRIWLTYSPTTPGTHTGALRVTEAGGRVTEVPLQGWAHGGTTRVTMQSEPGDYVGEGKTYEFGPAAISANGALPGVTIAAEDLNVGRASGTWSAARGSTLTPGGHYVVTPESSVDDARMSVGMTGRGCGNRNAEFDVLELTAKHELMRTFALTFVQRCTDSENPNAALRGTVEWRRGDTAAPAPWMQDNPAATATPAAGGPGTGPGAGPGGAGEPASAPNRSSCSGLVRAASAIRYGSSRKDNVRGTKKAELLFGARGNDSIRAGGGNDCADGGIGNDKLDGGSGADLLIGGPGRDVLKGGAGADVLACGFGRDTAYVGPGDTALGCERKIRVRR